jgi:tripartite-type tricarboxylate transporter receptor subunit TctC
MSTSRRAILKAGAATAMGSVAAPFIGSIGAAQAAWPDRPVRIVVPNTPGGPSDILARILSPVLDEALGGTFVIENKGGGGGNIGIGSVARAEPDGNTLLLCTSSIVVNPALYGDKLPYDPVTDFAPVAEIATSPNIIVIDSRLGIGSLKELMAAAKKEPDKFNVAVPPIGTTPQIAVEWLKLLEGVKLGVVVHAGGGQAIQSVLSGAVQVSSGGLPPAKAHMDAGTLRPLAVMGDARRADLPDVPTLVELGYKDFVLDTFLAVFAPSRTPPDIVQRLTKACIDGYSKPEIRARLVKAGFDVAPKGPDGLKARLAKEIPMFKDIVAKAGIKASDKG